MNQELQRMGDCGPAVRFIKHQYHGTYTVLLDYSLVVYDKVGKTEAYKMWMENENRMWKTHPIKMSKKLQKLACRGGSVGYIYPSQLIDEFLMDSTLQAWIEAYPDRIFDAMKQMGFCGAMNTECDKDQMDYTYPYQEMEETSESNVDAAIEAHPEGMSDELKQVGRSTNSTTNTATSILGVNCVWFNNPQYKK